MSLFHAIIIGAVQGLTEFLPVSSDGHLVITELFLRSSLRGADALGFDLLLHAASLLALLLCDSCRWTELARGALIKNSAARRVIMLLILGTVPGAVAGLLFKGVIETEMRTLMAAGVGFLVTAAVISGSEFLARKRRTPQCASDHPRISLLQTLIIGTAQAVAILPGVSRSGLTIGAGQMLGLSRADALNFSFLLAVPIIAGAVADAGIGVLRGSIILPALSVCIAGFSAAFLTSVLAIVVLRKLVARHSLAWFALYLVPLGIVLMKLS